MVSPIENVYYTAKFKTNLLDRLMQNTLLLIIRAFAFYFKSLG